MTTAGFLNMALLSWLLYYAQEAFWTTRTSESISAEEVWCLFKFTFTLLLLKWWCQTLFQNWEVILINLTRNPRNLENAHWGFVFWIGSSGQTVKMFITPKINTREGVRGGSSTRFWLLPFFNPFSLSDQRCGHDWISKAHWWDFAHYLIRKENG